MFVSKNILNFRVADYSEGSQTGQYKRVYEDLTHLLSLAKSR